jgi:colanic acid biosynthesis glycosyl transferase WcaI
MPSKLTGMLSSGRPVIATADGGTQVARVVEGADLNEACGLVVPADDAPALQDAVRQLIRDVDLRKQLGSTARRYAIAHLGREQVLERFEQDLQSLITGQ